MIIKLLLSAGLAACLFYAVSLGRSIPAMRMGLVLIVTLGLGAVWFPDATSVIAAWVGIGRGADLVMYIWIVLTLLFIVRLHLKLREQSEALTQLARKIALGGGSPAGTGD